MIDVRYWLVVLVTGVCAAAPASGSAQQHDVAPVLTRHIRPMPHVVPGELLVTFKKGSATNEARGALARASARALKRGSHRQAGKSGLRMKRTFPVLSRTGGRLFVLVDSDLSTAAATAALRQEPSVAAVSPNFVRTIKETLPDDTHFDMLWGLHNTGQRVNGRAGTPGADISAPAAWDRRTGAPDVVIVSLDSGVDYTHEDLSENMWINPGEIAGNGFDDDGNGYIDDICGIDAVDGDVDPMDTGDHGTHTSGIMAATGNNGSGVAGVAWDAGIMALRFLEEGSGTDADAITLIEYAVDMKINHDVNVAAINASWGGPGYNPVLEDAIRSAGEAGIVFVVAAGNYSLNNDHIDDYPTNFKLYNILGVGAIDQQDNLTSFSNYGPGTVEIAAPGDSILSTVPGGGYYPRNGDIFFDDMEGGAANWEHGGTHDTWALAAEAEAEKNYFWSDSPDGLYEHTTDSFLSLARDVDLSEVQSTFVMVGFSARIELESGYDFLNLEFSRDGGAVWDYTAAKITRGQEDWAGYVYYVPESFRTEQFRFRFRLISDGQAAYDGVSLDNVGVGTGEGSKTYGFKRGTSMSAPYVTGAAALVAAEYPDDTAAQLISRLLSGADLLEELEPSIMNGARLNAAASIDPGLVLNPFITGLSTDHAVVPGTRLTISGIEFGQSPGSVLFSSITAAAEADVLSWSDAAVSLIVPASPGKYVQIVRQDGKRSNRRSVSSWKRDVPLVTGLHSSAAAAYDGKLYVCGGYVFLDNETEDTSAACSVFDPATGAWSSLPDMPTPRGDHRAVAAGGRIYAIGGYDVRSGDVLETVEAFDPETGTWEQKEPLPRALSWTGAAVLDGRIYVAGGIDKKYNVSNRLYMYEPDNNTWEVLTGMDLPRYEHGAVAAAGGLYVFGGMTPGVLLDDFTSSAEKYDPGTDSWTTVEKMPFGCARMGTAYDGESVFLAGGSYSASNSLDDFNYSFLPVLFRYDPREDTWNYRRYDILELNFSRLAAPLVFLPYYGLYCIGGFNGYGLDGVERLDMYPPPDVSGLAAVEEDSGIGLSWANPVLDFAGCKLSVSYDNGTLFEEAVDVGTADRYSFINSDTEGRLVFKVQTYDSMGNVSPGLVADITITPACIFETAVSGSPLAGELEPLRDFRDRVLMSSALGRKVAALYYRFSPCAARFVEQCGPLRRVTRWAVRVLVCFAGRGV